MSNIFVPRTTAPALDDLNYISHYAPFNGYNYCIIIDSATGYVMPNCTGYAWGRWRELLGSYHNLSRGNASVWYGNTSDGYQRGQTAKIAAVACWSGGSDGAGHVGIVEDIDSTGFWMSNSAYQSYMFRYQHITGNFFQSGYTFQGFIYYPEEFLEAWMLNMKRKRKMKVVII